MRKIVPLLLIASAFIFSTCSKKEPEVYNLSTTASPADGGIIDPPNGSFEAGSEVSITAKASEGYIFKNWDGSITGTSNPREIIMTTDARITAVFEEVDTDGDGVSDNQDQCPGTPAGESVDELGCSSTQKDGDGDGVDDAADLCPETPPGESVDENGCSASQLDTDEDGITDDLDLCQNTPEGEPVDATGCSETQIDTDGDTVTDDLDECPDTASGVSVDENGCSTGQVDNDGDGVTDDLDECPNTASGSEVNENGCSECDLEPDACTDDDGDGVSNSIDICPDTPSGETVDADGCSNGQKDTTAPTVVNQFTRDLTATSVEIVAKLTELSKFRVDYGTVSGTYTDSSSHEVSFDYSTHGKELTDLAPNTTYYYRFEMEDQYGNKGFSEEYSITTLSLDEDGDGVNDSEDECLDTEPGVTVNAQGCQVTYIPDDDFEGFLISLGHDDVLDDYVLTETIKSITELVFLDESQFWPHDFTGLIEFSALQTLQFNWINGESADVLDVRGLEQLQGISSTHGPQRLILGNNINLKSIFMFSADAPVYDVPPPDFGAAPNLEFVGLSEAYNFYFLDFTENPKLKKIGLSFGSWSISDLSQNKLLEEFHTSQPMSFSGGIDNLDNPNLSRITVSGYISDNEILDLSKCPSLIDVVLDSSLLTGLNLKNGNNQNISSFYIWDRDMNCIEVDDPQFSEANWVGNNFNFPSGTVFSTDCGY